MVMKLATVLTPASAENLQLAAQCGVTDFVTRYPEGGVDALASEQEIVASHGMTISVIEGFLPIEHIKVGLDDGREMAEMKQLIRRMGELQIPVLCYNFMAGTDWVRTKLDAIERGGAKVTAFDLKEVERAQLMGYESSVLHSGSEVKSIKARALWGNLERMLEELLPVAELAQVKLAMHPDDPPLPALMGKERIMRSVEDFEKLVQLVPSPSNAICFCQGSFAEMGAEIPTAIRRLGPHICYAHFRDIRGSADCFAETFHDNGPTDMVAAMKAYRDVGFNGPIRPDHVPQMVGEESGEPGYTMRGRLFAYGYMRGLMQATE